MSNLHGPSIHLEQNISTPLTPSGREMVQTSRTGRLNWVSTLDRVLAIEREARQPLLAALEAADQLDACWTDESGHIQWDSSLLTERLVALRKALAATGSQEA